LSEAAANAPPAPNKATVDGPTQQRAAKKAAIAVPSPPVALLTIDSDARDFVASSAGVSSGPASALSTEFPMFTWIRSNYRSKDCLVRRHMCS
jgi:hypothetical protein